MRACRACGRNKSWLHGKMDYFMMSHHVMVSQAYPRFPKRNSSVVSRRYQSNTSSAKALLRVKEVARGQVQRFNGFPLLPALDKTCSRHVDQHDRGTAISGTRRRKGGDLACLGHVFWLVALHALVYPATFEKYRNIALRFGQRIEK